MRNNWYLERGMGWRGKTPTLHVYVDTPTMDALEVIGAEKMYFTGIDKNTGEYYYYLFSVSSLSYSTVEERDATAERLLRDGFIEICPKFPNH